MVWQALAAEAVKVGAKEATGGGSPAGPLVSSVHTDPVTSVNPTVTFAPAFAPFNVGGNAGAGVGTQGISPWMLFALGGAALWLMFSK